MIPLDDRCPRLIGSLKNYHLKVPLTQVSGCCQPKLIAGSPGGEACVCDLTEPVGLAQPTVSHHLKTLVDAGLLAREKRGRWAYYAITPAPLETLATHVESITRRPLPGD